MDEISLFFMFMELVTVHNDGVNWMLFKSFSLLFGIEEDIIVIRLDSEWLDSRTTVGGPVAAENVDAIGKVFLLVVNSEMIDITWDFETLFLFGMLVERAVELLLILLMLVNHVIYVVYVLFMLFFMVMFMSIVKIWCMDLLSDMTIKQSRSLWTCCLVEVASGKFLVETAINEIYFVWLHKNHNKDVFSYN